MLPRECRDLIRPCEYIAGDTKALVSQQSVIYMKLKFKFIICRNNLSFKTVPRDMKYIYISLKSVIIIPSTPKET
jgi:hypothetical protein